MHHAKGIVIGGLKNFAAVEIQYPVMVGIGDGGTGVAHPEKVREVLNKIVIFRRGRSSDHALRSKDILQG
jgi:hypothetical protein